MADDDEIDILGDFSFNSCFAQNNQGMWVNPYLHDPFLNNKKCSI